MLDWRAVISRVENVIYVNWFSAYSNLIIRLNAGFNYQMILAPIRMFRKLFAEVGIQFASLSRLA